jgi:AcrR family transcriptional regulator
MAAKAKRSPWASAKDREAEREEKREAVLHAAAEAFGANGYHKTSLDDIAERLGITKPTLYYYAKNKEDLIEAVAARAMNQLLAEQPGDPRAASFDKLRNFMMAYASIVTTDFGRCLVMLTDADLSAEAGARIREGKGLIDKRIRGLIEAGIEDRSIAPCDSKMTGFMLAGAVNGINTWFRAGGGHDIRSIAEIYVNQLGMGLIPRR